MHLAIGGPILLVIAGFAPTILTLLFSDQFTSANALLHGLMIGGLARLVSAPLETVLTASDRPRVVVLVSLLSLVTMICAAAVTYSHLGLAAIGASYAIANIVHLGILVRYSERKLSIPIGRNHLIWLAGLMTIGLVVFLVPWLAWLCPALFIVHPGARRRLSTGKPSLTNLITRPPA